MSRNTQSVIPPDAQSKSNTLQPTELTLNLIRQFARDCHTVKQLNIADNMISLS